MQEREQRARDAAQSLMKAVNEMGFDIDSFADEIGREHRTLQQNAFGAFLATVKMWAETRHFDLRNEWTIAKSKEIRDLLGPFGMKAPFI